MAQKYIRRGGMDVQPAPWISQQPLHAYIFQVPAAAASLQALCDRCLNDPSAGTPGALHYAPIPLAPLINDYVALTFQHFGGLRSHSGNADRPGMHHYNEASFWILTSNSDGPIEMFIPYMFVNDWVALASGREVYGFPKEYADVLEMPANNAGTFTVEALALKDVSAPADAISHRILQCVPADSPLDIVLALLQDVNLWPFIQALPGDELDAFLTPLAPVWDVLRMLRAGRLPLVFLRQFRALAGGDGADLQQIAAAEAAPFVVHSLNLLGPHELTIFPFESHPIAEELGLPVDQHGKIPLPICLELEIEFGIEPGRVVWQP